MLRRYISNELIDQRGSSRTTEMQSNMLYQTRQVVLPKLLPPSGQYLRQLNRSVERPESFAKTTVLENSCNVFGRPRYAVILRASHLAPMHASALTRRWEPGDAEPRMTRNVRYT